MKLTACNPPTHNEPSVAQLSALLRCHNGECAVVRAELQSPARRRSDIAQIGMCPQITRRTASRRAVHIRCSPVGSNIAAGGPVVDEQHSGGRRGEMLDEYHLCGLSAVVPNAIHGKGAVLQHSELCAGVEQTPGVARVKLVHANGFLVGDDGPYSVHLKDTHKTDSLLSPRVCMPKYVPTAASSNTLRPRMRGDDMMHHMPK
jgi:hypothetical protein